MGGIGEEDMRRRKRMSCPFMKEETRKRERERRGGGALEEDQPPQKKYCCCQVSFPLLSQNVNIRFREEVKFSVPLPHTNASGSESNTKRSSTGSLSQSISYRISLERHSNTNGSFQKRTSYWLYLCDCFIQFHLYIYSPGPTVDPGVLLTAILARRSLQGWTNPYRIVSRISISAREC